MAQGEEGGGLDQLVAVEVWRCVCGGGGGGVHREVVACCRARERFSLLLNLIES